NGDDDHKLLTGRVRRNARSSKKWLQGHCCDLASQWYFADHNQRLANESPVETSLPNVLLTIGGSSAIRRSPLRLAKNLAVLPVLSG
ncbi:hypothetical protein HAX54_013474, partial [Datura stramonium]|nr:hypothetical protein [Datura stramonium]